MMGIRGLAASGVAKRSSRAFGFLVLWALALFLVLVLGGCGGGAGDVGFGFSYPEFPDFPSRAPIRVPQDVPTISAAVENASPGDTVLVSPGFYKETVQVACSDLQIVGTDRDSVILEALTETGAISIAGGVKNVRIATMTIRPDPDTPTEAQLRGVGPGPDPGASSPPQADLALREGPLVQIPFIAVSQFLAGLADRPPRSFSLPPLSTTLIHTPVEGSAEGVRLEDLKVGNIRDDREFYTMGVDLSGVSGAVVQGCSFQGLHFGVGLTGSDGTVSDCSFTTLQCGILVVEAPQVVTLRRNSVQVLPGSAQLSGQGGFAVISSAVEVVDNTIDVDGTQAAEVSGVHLYDCPRVTMSGNQIRLGNAQGLAGTTGFNGLFLDSSSQLDVRQNVVDVQGVPSHGLISGAIIANCTSGRISGNTFATDCLPAPEAAGARPLQTAVTMLDSNVTFSENGLDSGPVSINLLADSSPAEFRANVFHVPASGYGLDIGNSGACISGNTFVGEAPAWGAIRSLTPPGGSPFDLLVQDNTIGMNAVFGVYCIDPGSTASIIDNEIRLESPGGTDYSPRAILVHSDRECIIRNNRVQVSGDPEAVAIETANCSASILENVVAVDSPIRVGIFSISDDSQRPSPYSVAICNNSVHGTPYYGVACAGSMTV